MDQFTESGHISGMLDRDQRTAKFSANTYRRHPESSFGNNPFGCGCVVANATATTSTSLNNVPGSTLHRTSISHHRTEQIRGRTSPSSSRVKKINRQFGVGISRLNRTLLLGFYLSVLTFPTISAAPSTKRPDMSSGGVEKWMRPCGVDRSESTVSNEVKTTDLQMINQIIDQSNRSHSKVNEFKEKFAQKIFKMDWKQLQELYKSHASYEWLPNSEQIPKALGEPLNQGHLNSLKLDTTLHNTYEYLQRVAVGFDQIVKEEKMLKNEFQEVETYVLSILCEIENAMYVRKLKKKPEIQSSIMPNNLKNGDSTSMNFRNYIILRDYINILEYVTACFEHLKTKA